MPPGLIGREWALEQLQKAFTSLRDSKGLKGAISVVNVFGVSGSGKSKLVEVFLSELKHSDRLQLTATAKLDRESAICSLVCSPHVFD